MFCLRCGTELPDDSRFCTVCGASMEQVEPRQGSGTQTMRFDGLEDASSQGLQRPRNPQGPQGAARHRGAAHQAQRDKSERSKRTIVIVSAIVIAVSLCVIGVAGAFATGLLGGSNPGGSGSVSLLSSRGSAPSGSEGVGQRDEQPDSESRTETEPEPEPPKALVDLSNADDYRDLNLFLSNFSEWIDFYFYGKDTIPFDRDNPNKKQLVNWGMWHNAINNDGTLVSKPTKLTGAPASSASRGIDAISADTYLRHMETQLIENSIKKFTGLDMDLAGYNSGDGVYFERDGIMYDGSYKGSANPLDHVTLCDTVEEIGESKVRVQFTIYSGNHSSEIVSDESWYGMNGSQLESAMLATGSQNVTKHSGTAIVEVIGSGDDRSFQLATYSVTW